MPRSIAPAAPWGRSRTWRGSRATAMPCCSRSRGSTVRSARSSRPSATSCTPCCWRRRRAAISRAAVGASAGADGLSAFRRHTRREDSIRLATKMASQGRRGQSRTHRTRVSSRAVIVLGGRLRGSLLACALVPSALAAQEPPAPPPSPSPVVVAKGLGEKIDEEAAALSALGFNGSVLIAKDGQVILCKGYGLANREKELANGPDTLFDVASLTKQFTAAALLKLE